MNTVNIYECGCARCNVPGGKFVCATIVRQLQENYYVALCDKCSEVYTEETWPNPGVKKELEEKGTTTKAVRVPLLESKCVSCLVHGKKTSGPPSYSIALDWREIKNMCKGCAEFWEMQNIYLRREQRVWVDEQFLQFKKSLKIREVHHEKVVVFE